MAVRWVCYSDFQLAVMKVVTMVGLWDGQMAVQMNLTMIVNLGD